MEYLAGEDFATVLRTAKRRGEQTPLNIVLRVVAETAVGLHFAHEALDPKGQPLNLVHRDISPSNIFITYSGQVKVLDFGIAKAESRATATGAGVVKGKYQYMSPEQARGDGLVDRRSDIFSLGVSLYEAVTGVRPFARDTDLAVLKAVLEGEYQPVRALRPDLPLEVESIINKAMAQEAEHRYPDALAMAHDIEKFIGATTSASGGQALVAFMAGFFGPDRVKSKTRIESLDELSARGIDVPGKNNPLSPKTDVGVLPNQDRTNVLVTPGVVKTDPAHVAKKPWPLLAGALVVGVVGAAVVVKLMQPAVVAVVIDAGAAVEPAPIDSGAAVVVDAGPVAVAPEPDAGSSPDEPPDAGKVGPVKPVVLTPALVVKRINTVKARIQKCFVEHKGDLPTPAGVLRVEFEIASSGKVTSITTSLPGTNVSKCVESAIRAAGFPRHVDQAIRVPLPLSWDVRGPALPTPKP